MEISVEKITIKDTIIDQEIREVEGSRLLEVLFLLKDIHRKWVFLQGVSLLLLLFKELIVVEEDHHHQVYLIIISTAIRDTIIRVTNNIIIIIKVTI